jgi:hypothetical protein
MTVPEPLSTYYAVCASIFFCGAVFGCCIYSVLSRRK